MRSFDAVFHFRSPGLVWFPPSISSQKADSFFWRDVAGKGVKSVKCQHLRSPATTLTDKGFVDPEAPLPATCGNEEKGFIRALFGENCHDRFF